MNNLYNTAQKYILIKDMSNEFDFGLINSQFSQLTFRDNISNKISDNMNFFDKDLFLDIKIKIVNECENYLNTTFALQPFYEGLCMTNSWGNVTDPGMSHHDHVHPFSIVSGVLFLDNNDSNLNLFIEGFMPDIPYFITKNKSYVGLRHLLADMGIDAAAEKNLQNHLILFLSNSSHFVDKTESTTTPRRSISFNTFWRGKTGVPSEVLGHYVF
jgi:hypothetical protein